MTVAVALAGALAAADNYAPSGWGWAHSRKLLLVIAVAAGVLTLASTIGDALYQRKSLAGEGRRVDIQKSVLAALVSVSEETSVGILDLGANVFRVQSDLRRGAYLDRVERVRLRDAPAVSNVRWTQGKGVIGDCWRNARPEHVHWAPIAARWHGKPIAESEWVEIAEEEKHGMSRADFVTMVGKYAEIHAVPIKDDVGNVIGVLAVDRMWHPDAPQGELLNSVNVQNVITTAASVLQTVLARA